MFICGIVSVAKSWWGYSKQTWSCIWKPNKSQGGCQTYKTLAICNRGRCHSYTSCSRWSSILSKFQWFFVCSLCNNRGCYMADEFDKTHKESKDNIFKNNTCCYQGFTINCHIWSSPNACCGPKYGPLY